MYNRKHKGGTEKTKTKNKVGRSKAWNSRAENESHSGPGFATGGHYSPPGAVWGMFYYGCARFIWRVLDCWTKTPAHCNDNAWNSQDNVLYNSDWICLNEESHIHLGCLKGE